MGHIGTAIHWELLFADDIALIGRMKEELQGKILNWQNELKRGGLKMSAEKSEILVMERNQGAVVRIVDTNGKELVQVEDFKYLGSVLEVEGGSWKAVKQRVKVAWMKWREMSGVTCDKRMPRKLKCKICRTVIRPVLLYGAECWTIRKKKENLLKRTEMQMLRWILGVSLKDKIWNDEIRRRCGVVCIAEKVKEAKLRWYGHVSRSKEEPIRSIMELNIEGNRGWGRPKKRWLDCVKEDLNKNGLTSDMMRGRSYWRTRIWAANPPGTVWD